MGRLEPTPETQSSDQTPFQPPPPQQAYPHAPPSPPPPQAYPTDAPPPPQGYPTDAQPPPPPQQDAYIPTNNQNMNHPQSSRSYIPQPPEHSPATPPPESYPPQKPAPYPPHQSPAAYPPQQAPAAYPPQQAPAAYPPQPEPVAFPPPATGNAATYNVQGYNYVQSSPAPVNYGTPAGYQTPMKEGIAVGSQYLAPTEDWTTDLFGCTEDPENAIITACFPCVTFGQIAEIVDNGQTPCATSGLLYGLISAFIGIPCIMSCSYRTKIRSRFGLMETPGPDWVTHLFCEWCALCQEYRELKARGWDPALGFQGNVVRNQQMQYSAMAPPTNQTMMS